MRKWVPYPFVRFVFFFILGILTGIFFNEYTSYLPVLLALAFLLFIALFFLSRRRTDFYSNALGICAFVMLYLIGYFHACQFDERSHPAHIFHVPDLVTQYQAVVTGSAKEKAKTYSVDIDVQAIRVDSVWLKATGKAKIYQQKKAGFPPLSYGDKIVANGGLELLKAPLNPFAFDYRQYLQFQNIFHSDYLTQNNLIVYEKGNYNDIFSIAFAIQSYGVRAIKKYIDDPSAEAIILALVLGMKDDLDDSLQNAYASTGVIHILAVSGLHVGIIFIILNFLFGWLQKGKTKWLFALIVLLILWVFALVTGLSPSVSRAVTMFSCFVIAKAINRQTNIYNTLAASAFVLLCFNPFWIMSVGFQLSYLAVLGIVSFYPRIYALIDIRNSILDKIWQLLSVSLSAQVVVLPLILYYFNQFPTYFLLANLVMIPGAFLILALGLGLITTNFLEPLASLIGSLLETLVVYLNAFVYFVQQLPFSTFSDLFISKFQVFILFTFIIVIIGLFRYKKIQWVVFLVALVFLFQGDSFLRNWDKNDARRVIYFSIKDTGVMLLLDGKSQALISTGGKEITETDFAYNIQPLLLKHSYRPKFNMLIQHSQEEIQKRELDQGELIIWNGYKILVLNKMLHQIWSLKAKLEVDLLIVENNAVRQLSDIPPQLKYKHLLLGNSCDSYLVRRWRKHAKIAVKNLHYPRLEGAFIIDLNE